MVPPNDDLIFVLLEVSSSSLVSSRYCRSNWLKCRGSSCVSLFGRLSWKKLQSFLGFNNWFFGTFKEDPSYWVGGPQKTDSLRLVQDQWRWQDKSKDTRAMQQPAPKPNTLLSCSTAVFWRDLLERGLCERNNCHTVSFLRPKKATGALAFPLSLHARLSLAFSLSPSRAQSFYLPRPDSFLRVFFLVT